MEIRKLTPDEHRAADVLESLSFIIPLAGEQKEEKEDAYQPDRWGVFDDQNRLTATFTNHNLPFYLGGGIAAARGVAGVASDPVSRGSGHVRALFAHVLRDDRANGALFSALYPFSHLFYRKFGYEICYEHRKARFPTRALKIYRTGDPPQARLLYPKDGTAALRPIYEAFARRYTFMVARDEHSWNRLRVADPLKAEKYCYILSRGGRDIAYAVFSYRPGEKPYIRTLCLTDFAFVHHKAFNDLMGFLYRYTAQAQTTEIFLPEDLPIATLLQESYKVEYASGSWPMARALHVENILKVMRHPAEDGVY
ncbi:MAG: GNAT family N-acetyltransferase, partial [Bacillota bacterium]